MADSGPRTAASGGAFGVRASEYWGIDMRVPGFVFGFAALAASGCDQVPAQTSQGPVKPEVAKSRSGLVGESSLPSDIPPGTKLPVPEGMRHLSADEVRALLHDGTRLVTTNPGVGSSWHFNVSKRQVVIDSWGAIVPKNDLFFFNIQNNGQICFAKSDHYNECTESPFLAIKNKTKKYYIIWYGYTSHGLRSAQGPGFIRARYNNVSIRNKNLHL